MAVNIKTTVLLTGALCSLIDWYCLRQTCCLPFQVFRPKDEWNMFYGNICTLLPDSIASYPQRLSFWS